MNKSVKQLQDELTGPDSELLKTFSCRKNETCYAYTADEIRNITDIEKFK